MKVWRFEEAQNKLLEDLDLQDETFISPTEMVGYFNDAIQDAESEIQNLTLAPDYFLTSKPLPLVTGQSEMVLPSNIYANKIRSVVYQNGAIIYPITKLKSLSEFLDVAFGQQFGQADDYRYLLKNDEPGQIRMLLTPVSRDQALLPPPLPYPEAFTPVVNIPALIWYVRSAQRMPIPTYNNVQGELLPRESVIPANVDIALDQITTICGSIKSDGVTPAISGGQYYKFGDIVYFTTTGTLPAPLLANTPYYVIETATPGVIQLALSQQLAAAGTAIDLTTQGTGYHQLSVVTTVQILSKLLIDIPQFMPFVIARAKWNCLFKEKDPRLSDLEKEVNLAREQMVSTLGKMVSDMDDEIPPDFSSYDEMS